ncbi:S1 family peptidase [Actinomadura litoris]|uniref:S1 family peptidase n=1 Tax=Actinomadura litoris TaxID=2678616 RepID=UPI001FA78482|nr:S1 family peptidase [Actinomadura litoris]
MTATVVVCALSSAARAEAPRPPDAQGSALVLKAMQRDLRIDEATARHRLAAEDAAAKAEAALVPALGSGYAGSWFDAPSGKLVVNLTDGTLAPRVSRGGAVPRVLSKGHGLAELRAVKAKLDAQARSAPAAAAGVVSWRVDPVTDRVVVTTIAGRARGALARAAAAEGDAVRFETTAQPAVSSSEWLDGGEGILSGQSICSVGFNAVQSFPDAPGSSSPVVISAGHCAKSATVNGFANSHNISTPMGRWWLSSADYDWGVIGAIDTAFWHQGPYISLHTAADNFLLVRGTQERPIGSSICKSGFTTNITCGVIRARWESVYLSDMGRTIYNLTRDTTCTEKGDSGGPHYTGDGQAQGVGSASTLSADHCLQNIGQENRSWYVEINFIQGYTSTHVMTY